MLPCSTTYKYHPTGFPAIEDRTRSFRARRRLPLSVKLATQIEQVGSTCDFLVGYSAQRIRHGGSGKSGEGPYQDSARLSRAPDACWELVKRLRGSVEPVVYYGCNIRGTQEDEQKSQAKADKVVPRQHQSRPVRPVLLLLRHFRSTLNHLSTYNTGARSALPAQQQSCTIRRRRQPTPTPHNRTT